MYPAHLLTKHLSLRERIAAAIDDISLGRMDLVAIGDFLGEVREGVTEEVADAVSLLEREKRDLESDNGRLEEDLAEEEKKWDKLKKQPKLWAAIEKVLADRRLRD